MNVYIVSVFDAINDYRAMYLSGQIFEKKVRAYVELMASGDDLPKRSRLLQGHEVVRSDLETMNKTYMDLLIRMHHRLKMLKQLHDQDGLFFPVLHTRQAC